MKEIPPGVEYDIVWLTALRDMMGATPSAHSAVYTRLPSKLAIIWGRGCQWVLCIGEVAQYQVPAGDLEPAPVLSAREHVCGRLLCNSNRACTNRRLVFLLLFFLYCVFFSRRCRVVVVVATSLNLPSICSRCTRVVLYPSPTSSDAAALFAGWPLAGVGAGDGLHGRVLLEDHLQVSEAVAKEYGMCLGKRRLLAIFWWLLCA